MCGVSVPVPAVVWDEPPLLAPVLSHRSGRNRKTEVSPWIGCPVCGVVTIEAHPGGAVIRLLDTASDHRDGARCARHSRSLEERAAESDNAQRIAGYRMACSSLRALCWIDDIAQGAE